MIIKPQGFRESPEIAEEPLSAGTFVSYICAECVDENGMLFSTPMIDTPHPTYTNSNGKAVVQLQCVALGGINGLNS